jgi:hypothetical protein
MEGGRRLGGMAVRQVKSRASTLLLVGDFVCRHEKNCPAGAGRFGAELATAWVSLSRAT